MSTVKISAADVKALRDLTGAPMMDCKKALTEAEGDKDKAIEILRKKGQKMVAKRAERSANEGVVVAKVSDDRQNGIVIRLSCETDFVAKNDDFVKFAESIAGIALVNLPADLEALKALPYNDELTVDQKIVEQVGVIGEKVELADYQRVNAAMVAPYIHTGYRAGVLVGLNKASDDIFVAGRDVAMQVAAMKPLALDKGDVDPSVIEKEIEIGKEVARKEGKPEQMLEKIAMGKLNKFYKENTLLNQQFVKDNKSSVSQYLKSLDKELTVTEFKHITLG